jgi:hypothetical protein
MSYKDFQNKTNDLLADLPVDKETFCPLPFTHVSTMPHGEIKLCCRGQKPSGGKNPFIQKGFDLKEYWNSDYMNEVRDSLINGVKINQCKNCWKMEDNEIVSLRHNRITDLMHLKSTQRNIRQYLDEGKIDFRIPIIELKLSNVCNFKCRMCWPKDSSKWVTDWDAVKRFYDDDNREYIQDIIDDNGLTKRRVMNLFEQDENFVGHLVEVMQHVNEIEFAGGEPLMDPIHYRVLDSIPNPENVTLKYSTNLSIMKMGKHNVLDLWKKFKSIKLTISIDGHKHLNAKIRRGADWDLLKSNIALCKELPNIDVIKGTTCISAMNAMELGDTAKAIVEELGIHWHTSRLQWPDFLHANVLTESQLNHGIINIERYANELAFRQNVKRKKMLLTHLNGAANWLQECIKNNNHENGYQRYQDFMNTIDNLED